MAAGAGILSIFFLIIVLLVPVGLMVGLSVLQVYLSRRDSKWPGLILPAVSFILPLIMITGLLLYRVHNTTINVQHHADIIEQRQAQIEEHEANREAYRESGVTRPEGMVMYYSFHELNPQTGAPVVTTIFILIIFNIPTAIFLAIYAACRTNRKKQLAHDINRMSLQDL